MVDKQNELETEIDLNAVDEFLDMEMKEEHVQRKNYKAIRLENKKYKNLSIIFTFILIILGIALYVINYISNYYLINAKDKLDDTDKLFIENFKENQKQIFSRLSYENTDVGKDINVKLTDSNENSETIQNKINGFINRIDVDYLSKKEKIGKLLTDIITEIGKSRQFLDNIKTDMTKYAFLPKDLDTLCDDNELQRSIISMEAIKFFTALKVFYYMDSFLDSSSVRLGLARKPTKDYLVESSKRYLEDFMQYYIERGEGDTERFLISCYLNPYELTDKCISIGDFDEFYRFNGIANNFVATNFKNLIQFITQELENADFPILTIVLNNMNPKDKNISFSIELNTKETDELNLVSKGIINPQIYMVSTLVDLLRESHFIIGSSIKMDTLKVNKKKIKIGNTEYDVKTSNFSYNIPLQKPMEREIYDYLDNVQINKAQVNKENEK